MSLISRLRHHFPNGFSKNPHLSLLISLDVLNFNGVMSRGFAQASRKEEEEEKEYEKGTKEYLRKPRSPPTERICRLADEINGLTVVEVARIRDHIMKKREMKQPAPIQVMMPSEKAVFKLKLESYEASSKIKVMKEVRSVSNLDLQAVKNAMKEVRSVSNLDPEAMKVLLFTTPVLLKEGVSKEDGEQIIEKMKVVGAKVVMEKQVMKEPGDATEHICRLAKEIDGLTLAEVAGIHYILMAKREKKTLENCF